MPRDPINKVEWLVSTVRGLGRLRASNRKSRTFVSRLWLWSRPWICRTVCCVSGDINVLRPIARPFLRRQSKELFPCLVLSQIATHYLSRWSASHPGTRRVHWVRYFRHVAVRVSPQWMLVSWHRGIVMLWVPVQPRLQGCGGNGVITGSRCSVGTCHTAPAKNRHASPWKEHVPAKSARVGVDEVRCFARGRVARTS